MTRWLNTWPPAVWLAVYLSSLLVLMGGQRAELGIVGMSILLIAFGVAIYLAIRPTPRCPPPKGFVPLMADSGRSTSSRRRRLHDDITPHDLPPGHPARRKAGGAAALRRRTDARRGLTSVGPWIGTSGSVH